LWLETMDHKLQTYPPVLTIEKKKKFILTKKIQKTITKFNDTRINFKGSMI